MSRLYSSSDDQTVREWDMSVHTQSAAKVPPEPARSATQKRTKARSDPMGSEREGGGTEYVDCHFVGKSLLAEAKGKYCRPPIPNMLPSLDRPQSKVSSLFKHEAFCA